jgi:hypothetical protein
MTLIRYGTTILLILSAAVHAAPCPGLYLAPEKVGEFADWIVEGKVTEVRKAGTFKACDRVLDVIHCADIDKPEIVSLDNINIVQDKKGQFDSAQSAEVSRMAHCFSSPLSRVMNAKPELNALGKRVRFYGRTDMAPPFFEPQLKPGYFWIEIFE